ncbi:MAG TPA: aminotransferase class V-fold PLP-dependent enzyme, partial [Clostridiales bacterium]|nr:aminotransferase class V-fold PLP-dependent enzyme [Clostridiales bacterium]
MAIYFDNSATTKPCDEAVAAVKKAVSESYGNPSSLHFLGIRAHDDLEKARRDISEALGCRFDCLYFAPSGTYANNAAIFGVWNRL